MEWWFMNTLISPTNNPGASDYAKAVWEDESPAQGGQLQSIHQETGKSPRIWTFAKVGR
jgi:hypothetical protein